MGRLQVVEFPWIPGWKDIAFFLQVFTLSCFLAYTEEQRNYLRWVEFQLTPLDAFLWQAFMSNFSYSINTTQRLTWLLVVTVPEKSRLSDREHACSYQGLNSDFSSTSGKILSPGLREWKVGLQAMDTFHYVPLSCDWTILFCFFTCLIICCCWTLDIFNIKM